MKLSKFKDLKNSELFRGSIILLILLNLANIVNYIFQLSMARMLGPVDYGMFAVLTNFVYIFSVPTLSIQTVVSKNITKYTGNNEKEKIRGFFIGMVKKSILLSSIFFIVFVIMSFFLSPILKIPLWLLILTGTFLFGSFIYPIALGVLQGLKRFNSYGWNYIFASAIKLIVAVILVYLGLRVYGAIGGFIVSVTIPFIIAIPTIRKIIGTKSSQEKVVVYSRDSIITFFAILIIVFIYSADVIFVRIFFAPEVVGRYAVISMIGKMILFAAMAVGSAMFPITSERHNSGDKTQSIFKKAILATIFICSFSILIFALFPDLVIKILFGNQYLELTKILIYVGIAFSFIALLNLFLLYKISNDKLKIRHVIGLVMFFFLEILMFFVFRSNIEYFSIGFMCSTIIMFIGAVILIRN